MFFYLRSLIFSNLRLAMFYFIRSQFIIFVLEEMRFWMPELDDSGCDYRIAGGLLETVGSSRYTIFFLNEVTPSPVLPPQDQIRNVLLSKELKRFPAEIYETEDTTFKKLFFLKFSSLFRDCTDGL